jgi:hypothetical protein
MSRLILTGLLALLVVAPAESRACSLCQKDLLNSLTFRQEAALKEAKIILLGSVEKSDLTNGTSKIRILSVVRSDPFLKDDKSIELPKYIPVPDPKDPPKFLIYCDVFQNKLDPYRGINVTSEETAKYLKGALALDQKETAKNLLYYFDYLEHRDPHIAKDAFMEFAKASDQEIGQVAGKLSAARLRGWLQDPKTEEMRLGLYAFLLGACGGAEDAAALRDLLQKPSDRTTRAFDGLLGGYIQLKPDDGWRLALDILRDSGKDYRLREAILRTMRFFYAWKPKESKDQILKGVAGVLPQGDLADIAIEDLRRWKLWDLTDDVLALYGRKSHDAPLMRRAIIRYAICCPQPRAAEFITQRRRDDAEAVRDVEESVQAEKTPSK